jgi:hypothetical protein
MIYTIYAQKDATIYEKTEHQNTGLDQLVELSHLYEGTSGSGKIYNSRILMKFDMDDIEQKVNSGKISQNAKYYLSLKTVDSREIPQEYTVYAYPVSSSWINGTGKFYNKPITTDGVSWTYRTSKNVGVMWDIPPTLSSLEWDEVSQTWIQDDAVWGNRISISVTSSYNTNEGGGTWWDYDDLECTQSFYYQTSDVYMNVTDIAKRWITGSARIENDGFILKFSNDVETSNDSSTSLKFFGTDSNTIYVPKLYVVWDDSEFSTGSLNPVPENGINLNLKLKKFYSQNEKAKIRIHANKLFPTKTYSTQSYYNVNYYLPSSSYYEVRDAHTDEIILPFDNIGTKISCDSTGNYFNIWMNSFQPERFYRIVVKVETDGGDVVTFFDNNYYFKVTR